MAFELFKDTGTRTKEFISVTERMSFGLSRAFLDNYKITSDHKAVIFFDAEENKIALYFSLAEPKFGFAVRIPNEKHGASIVARSFFEVKKVDAKKYAGRYSDFAMVPLREMGLNQDGKAFVISLKEQEPKPEDDGADVVLEDIDDRPIDLSEIPF